MPRRSRYGVVDRDNPQAAARCDAGGEIVRRSDLRPQLRWVGNRLVPNGFLVCARHYDLPNPQDRPIFLAADPVPVRDPRPNTDMPAPSEVGALLGPTFILGSSLLSPGGGFYPAEMDSDFTLDESYLA